MDRGLRPNGNGLYKLDRERLGHPRPAAWLRRTSLDELPQLFNVSAATCRSSVRVLPRIRDRVFEPHHFERFLVPQGITGLWQVDGARAR